MEIVSIQVFSWQFQWISSLRTGIYIDKVQPSTNGSYDFSGHKSWTQMHGKDKLLEPLKIT